MKFKERIIHTLGGHTAEEYNAKSMELDAVKSAHSATLGWFKGTILRADMQGQRYRASVATELRDNMPIEYAKEQICRRLADDLIERDLVAFDVRDDQNFMGGMSRLYTGEITVLVPASYGSHY